ncbi:hypothetical protein RQN30_07390 [Arcanobacterium hippocoleae]
MLTEKKIQHGILTAGMSFTGTALGFLIVFLVKASQGESVIDWYIFTVAFTDIAAVLLTVWYSGKKNPEKIKQTLIATSIAGVISAAAFITWGLLFLN